MKISTTIKGKNASQQMRVVRGYAIISKGDTPKQIGKQTYTIPSQSGNGEYTISKNGTWTCTCPDYESRKLDCKHINAVKFYLDLQQKLKQDDLEIEEPVEKPVCIYCSDTDVVKYGKRPCRDKIKQKYRCNKCHNYFILDKDFERIKGDAKTTTLILDLYVQGN